MKPAGVPWPGEVPRHWDVRRLKGICRLQYGESLPADVREEGTIPVFGSNGRVGLHSRANTQGPCLVIGRKGSFGKVSLSADPVFAIDTTFFVDGRSTATDMRWLNYLLGWLRLDEVSKDSAVPGLDREDAYQRLALLPPLAEQVAIGRFLDHADRRIRRYIRAKQRLIAVLEEHKRTAVNTAVTHGLDPAVRLRQSGTPRLGRVPEHWEVRRLRNVAGMIVSNVDKLTVDGEQPVRLCSYVDVYRNERITEAVDFMPASAAKDEMARFRLEPRDVLITKDSEMWTDIGVPSLVEYTSPDLVCGYHLAILRADPRRLDGRYLLRALQSQSVAVQMHSSANGVTRFGLSQEAIKSIALPIPPMAEQRAIVDTLDATTADLGRAAAAARQEVVLLREYRTRLIADVVTGKIDVREAAARMPEEFEEPLDEADAVADLDGLMSDDVGAEDQVES